MFQSTLFDPLRNSPLTRWLFKEIHLNFKKKRKKKKGIIPRVELKNPIAKGASKEQVMQGTVYHNTSSIFTVNGRDILRNSGTWVIGELVKGMQVTVNVARLANGKLYAKKIVSEDQRGKAIKDVKLKEGKDDKNIDQSWLKEVEQEVQKTPTPRRVF